MTQPSFKKYLEKLNFVELSKLYDAHNRYFSPHGYDKGKTRSKYFGYCQELIDDMCENGASAEELERAIIFSYVVLDADKCRLSILKAKDDLCIQELYEKYVIGESQ